MGFQLLLAVAAFLCSLVAGLLFTFAVVVMPGIGSLNAREFVRSFQVIDQVIQNNQPVFMAVWVGSIVSLIVAAVLGFGRLEGLERLIFGAALAAYLLGVQLPTIVVNVPLNNELQTIDLAEAGDADLTAHRAMFEPRWNRWNEMRTLSATLASVLLIVLVLRL